MTKFKRSLVGVVGSVEELCQLLLVESHSKVCLASPSRGCASAGHLVT